MNYTELVKATTSSPSEYLCDLVRSLEALEEEGVNSALLLTAAMGLGSESGEFQEIVKKVIFQGKPLDTRHLIRELGDIMWYWTNACRALGVNPDDVVAENIEKLKSRYPAGTFSVEASENRAPGDL